MTNEQIIRDAIISRYPKALITLDPVKKEENFVTPKQSGRSQCVDEGAGFG